MKNTSSKAVVPRSLDSELKILLNERLLLPVIFASLIVLIISAIYGGQLVERQQRRLVSSVRYSAEEFLSYATSEINEVGYQAVQISSVDDFRVSMESSWRAHKLFETLYLLDEEGIIQTLVPLDSRYLGFDMSRRTYFTELDCAAGVNISTPFLSLRTGNPTVYLTGCMNSGHALVGELNLDALQKSISAGQSESQPVKAFIVDQYGTLLAHPDKSLVETQNNVSNWEIVKQGLQEDTVARYWSDGNFWLGITQKIEPTGWVVVVEVTLWNVYGAYLGAMFVLVVLMSSIFSIAAQRFLKRAEIELATPLIQLSESTDALAAGDYSYSKDLASIPYSFDEVQRLTTNFLNMQQAILSRETLLTESERQYRSLVENSPNAIIVHHGDEIVYVNSAAVELYRALDASMMIGKHIKKLVHPDSHALLSSQLKKIGEQASTTLPAVEQKHIRFDKSVFPAEVSTSSIFFRGKHEVQSIVRDITRRKDEEQRLKYQATHDFLTGLPNRFLFHDRLQHALNRAKRSSAVGAVLYLDLDRFKSINDVYGHETGDVVLQEVSKRLRTLLRESDTVARLGGDEFVVLLEDLDNVNVASLVANHILQDFFEPLNLNDNEILISFSIGISLYPQDGSTVQILLQAADAAMYNAKDEGKHRFKFYSEGMRAFSSEQILLASQLHRALQQQEFFLQYQPQIDSRDGSLVGVEALIRWRHPKLGLVPPNQFISLAEDTGLITQIGEQVLKMACEQRKQWDVLCKLPFRVSVNVSNVQLKQPDLVFVIQGILDQTGLLPELLELELTENVIFQNTSDSFEKLYRLKAMGIRLAVDDFGTGYSTLSHLSQFPFDILKIDQRLAPNVTTASKDVAIVSGVIKICENLGLEVIAEGVERQDQLDFYQSQGCYNIQGWYFSRPVDAAEITKVLESTKNWGK